MSAQRKKMRGPSSPPMPSRPSTSRGRKNKTSTSYLEDDDEYDFGEKSKNNNKIDNNNNNSTNNDNNPRNVVVDLTETSEQTDRKSTRPGPGGSVAVATTTASTIGQNDVGSKRRPITNTRIQAPATKSQTEKRTSTTTTKKRGRNGEMRKNASNGLSHLGQANEWQQGESNHHLSRKRRENQGNHPPRLSNSNNSTKRDDSKTKQGGIKQQDANQSPLLKVSQSIISTSTKWISGAMSKMVGRGHKQDTAFLNTTTNNNRTRIMDSLSNLHSSSQDDISNISSNNNRKSNDNNNSNVGGSAGGKSQTQINLCDSDESTDDGSVSGSDDREQPQHDQDRKVQPSSGDHNVPQVPPDQSLDLPSVPSTSTSSVSFASEGFKGNNGSRIPPDIMPNFDTGLAATMDHFRNKVSEFVSDTNQSATDQPETGAGTGAGNFSLTKVNNSKQPKSKDVTNINPLPRRVKDEDKKRHIRQRKKELRGRRGQQRRGRMVRDPVMVDDTETVNEQQQQTFAASEMAAMTTPPNDNATARINAGPTRIQTQANTFWSQNTSVARQEIEDDPIDDSSYTEESTTDLSNRTVATATLKMAPSSSKQQPPLSFTKRNGAKKKPPKRIVPGESLFDGGVPLSQDSIDSYPSVTSTQNTATNDEREAFVGYEDRLHGISSPPKVGKKKAKGGKKVHSRGEWSGSNSVDNTSTSTNTTPSQNRRSRFKNKRDSQQQHQQPETIEIMDDDDDDVPDDVDDDHDHNDEIDGSTNGDSGNLGGSNATKCGRSAESENLPPLHLRGDTTQRYDLLALAVEGNVYKSNCKLVWDPKRVNDGFVLLYDREGQSQEGCSESIAHTVLGPVYFSDIIHCHYYTTDPKGRKVFVVLLSIYSSTGTKTTGDEDDTDDNIACVEVEFQNDEDVAKFIEIVRRFSNVEYNQLKGPEGVLSGGPPWTPKYTIGDGTIQGTGGKSSKLGKKRLKNKPSTATTRKTTSTRKDMENDEPPPPPQYMPGEDRATVLFVYPFAGDAQEIEFAAHGLREASGGSMILGQEQGEHPQERAEATDGDQKLPAQQQQPQQNPSPMEPPPTTGTSTNAVATVAPAPRRRAHYVTIRLKDYDRLEPMEWLNDSLVDLWMQWISRSDTSLSSDFHFFTSHFYTTLSTEGPGAVRSWTARKKINIFEKRLIFVPINKDLHWSLCVVVNPGSILLTADRSIGKNNNNNNNDDKIDQKPRYTSSDPLPCLIFLDSLRMHNKRKVAKHLHLWLNAEWDRIYPTASSTTPPPPTKIITTTTRTTNDDGSVVKSTAMTTNVTTATTKEEENSRRSSKTELFNLKSLTLFSPTVPYQNNTWDCGVFVCRYAYSIFQLRKRGFTFGDAGLSAPSGGNNDNNSSGNGPDNSSSNNNNNKNSNNKKKLLSGKKKQQQTAFYRLITKGSEFDFDMEDIKRFREEFKLLIRRLAEVYAKWKRSSKKEGKQQKRQNDSNEKIDTTKVNGKDNDNDDDEDDDIVITTVTNANNNTGNNSSTNIDNNDMTKEKTEKDETRINAANDSQKLQESQVEIVHGPQPKPSSAAQDDGHFKYGDKVVNIETNEILTATSHRIIDERIKEDVCHDNRGQADEIEVHKGEKSQNDEDGLDHPGNDTNSSFEESDDMKTPTRTETTPHLPPPPRPQKQPPLLLENENATEDILNETEHVSSHATSVSNDWNHHENTENVGQVLIKIEPCDDVPMEQNHFNDNDNCDGDGNKNNNEYYDVRHEETLLDPQEINMSASGESLRTQMEMDEEEGNMIVERDHGPMVSDDVGFGPGTARVASGYPPEIAMEVEMGDGGHNDDDRRGTIDPEQSQRRQQEQEHNPIITMNLPEVGPSSSSRPSNDDCMECDDVDMNPLDEGHHGEAVV